MVLTATSRSPHHLAPLDRRFIVSSIAAAYQELPEVFKELQMIRDKAYSSSVKKYCDDVLDELEDIYGNAEVRSLCANVKPWTDSMEE